MKVGTKIALSLALLSIVTSEISDALAQGTVFSYQGRLNDNGSAANGLYDLTFTVYAVSNGGSPLAGSLTNAPLSVSNGLFTVAVDFGAGVFTGADRWVQIGVRTNGSISAYQALMPRQQITSAPYAIRAANFSGAISDSQLSANMARLNGTNQAFTGIVQFNNLSNTFTGTFSGNGAAVTNVNLATLNSLGAISVNSNLFRLAASLNTGAGPEKVAVADVNGDGRPDLLSANALSNSVSVFTNNGSGGFALASSPTVGSDHDSLVAADVNGDGRVDLISGSRSSILLQILTNDGAGGFVLSSSPNVGAGSDDIVAADVNNDGRTDLITIGDSAQLVSILTNNGSGGFPTVHARFVPAVAYSVAAGDFNGDGWLDIVSANYVSNAVSVLTNAGNGVFTNSPLFFAVDGSPYAVVTGDVTGDGLIDIVSGSSAGTISVLTNNGAASFTLGSVANPLLGSANSITTADMNGDGRLDIIGAHINAAKLSVLTNNGNGVFSLASAPAVCCGPIYAAAADVNGDNRPDLISANYYTYTLSVLLQTALVTFAGDFRGDGSAVTNLSAGALSLGTIPDARLGSNVALLNASQTFTATHSFGSGAQLLGDSGSASAPGFSFSGDANNGLFRPAADTLALSTAGAERVRVTSAGNVGIGTNAPVSKLHVIGDVQASGDVRVGSILSLSSTTVAAPSGGTLTPSTSYVRLTALAGPITLGSTAIAYGATVGTMLILEGPSSNTVTINDGSNVQLGAATRVLGANDTLMLVWNGTDWLELSFVNN